MNACLSPYNTSATLPYVFGGELGGLTDLMEEKFFGRVQKLNNGTQGMTEVECYPLFSVLASLDITHVVYFSLDVESAEVEILRTIPFDKITFLVH